MNSIQIYFSSLKSIPYEFTMRNIFKKLNKNENDIINIDISELSIEDVTMK